MIGLSERGSASLAVESGDKAMSCGAGSSAAARGVHTTRSKRRRVENPCSEFAMMFRLTKPGGGV